MNYVATRDGVEILEGETPVTKNQQEMITNLLRDFPADVLKLDKSFIDNHTNTRRDNVVVANIARMAKELNMRVITEGVENWDQVDFLKGVDIKYVQGYLFDRPMSREDFEQRLANRQYDQDASRP